MERIKLIKNICEESEERKIRYCILRNYDFLLEEREPRTASERSIDMVVAEEDFSAFESFLFSVGFQKRKPQFSRAHHAFFIFLPEQRKMLSFDVQLGGVHWNDHCYLSENFVIGNRVKKNFFYAPATKDTVVMLLLHSLLGKRRFKPEYQDILRNICPKINGDEHQYVLERIQEIFPKSTAEEMVYLLFQQNFNALLKRRYKYIFIFISKAPVNFTALFLRWLWWKRPRKYPLISVIGPDGAGKSTLARALHHYLLLQGKKSTIIYTGRGRNQFLPFATLGKKYKSFERKREEKEQQLRNGLERKISFRKIAVYTFSAPIFAFDLLLRYWLLIYPLRWKKRMVITDRYGTDIFLMQNVPLWFKRGLLHFFPKPTITFYLYNTPEVLHARREEESIQELERQLALFSVLENELSPVKIKTENPVKDTTEIIKKVIELAYEEWY